MLDLRELTARFSRRATRLCGLKSGLGQIANRLDRWLPSRSPDLKIVRMPDGIWMRIDPCEFVGRLLFWTADYDPKIWSVLSTTIRDGDRVIDIGAHCGTYGLRAARHVGATGRVVMVEPNPTLAAEIDWSINRNGLKSAVLRQVAVGEFDGPTVLRFTGNESVTATIQSASPIGGMPNRSVQVECLRLESLMAELGLDRVDVMKIDAEGMDEAIIKQALVLRSPPRCIVFELHHQLGDAVWSLPLMSSLRDAGYEVKAIAKSLLRLGYLNDGASVPLRCFDFVATRLAGRSNADNRI